MGLIFCFPYAMIQGYVDFYTVIPLKKGGRRFGGDVLGILELLAIGVGLSMDAFAVSVCKGLSMRKMDGKKALITGCWFGGFQAMMPLLGYVLGVSFSNSIRGIDHWIAFFLLGAIGANMIKESLGDENDVNPSFDIKTMFTLALATSIDALAVGVTFAFLRVSILPAVTIIGVLTLLISVAGVKIGNVFGAKYKRRAELAGGIILILMGIKILIEHLI